MLLTELAIKNAKPQKKPYKMSDGDGMFLLVDPKGLRHWRFRYYFGGKEKLLSFGAYPEVTLKEARQKRYDSRKLVREGIDPSAQRQEKKRLAQFDSANTFKTVAKEWFEANKNKWTPDHADRLWRRLELHTFPKLGNRPIKEIRPVELLDVIRKIEKCEATHLSHRVLQISRAVFRYAIITGRAEYNPAGDLQGALVAHKETHYPTLDVKELPQFLKALEEMHTTKQNKLAIRLLMFTFMRQGELRHSKWEDIDFTAKVWRIPAENTKMRDAHIVPLTCQVISLLGELKALTGYQEYLFPSQHRQKHPIMSENTINSILIKMGYKGKIVGHGFRALASTILNEKGFRADIIERQLAHLERNKVRAAYNRAEYMDERREMMQWWADYLDQTKTKAS